MCVYADVRINALFWRICNSSALSVSICNAIIVSLKVIYRITDSYTYDKRIANSLEQVTFLILLKIDACQHRKHPYEFFYLLFHVGSLDQMTASVPDSPVSSKI